MAITLFVSCMENVAYHHYEPIPREGWYVRDTVTFHIDTIPATANYTTYLCLRTTPDYPYHNFAAMVTQYIPTQSSLTRKTVSITVKDDDNMTQGQGIIYLTNEIPVTTQRLKPGDSLRIVVQHRMRRETMPGIMDVGIKLQAN